jgi:hypothetical protein
MVPYAELESFFTSLIATAQSRGVTCAITSGMACVHFGIAATTKDCDVLCAVEKADDFRHLIAETELHDLLPNYRGNISPPLDARWMRGGWTSHFIWKTHPEETCLDVFGIAPRGSSRWEQDIEGLYASRHTVAEMKRTNRGKDWPYISALGIKLLKQDDVRGCLHISDASQLLAAVEVYDIPPWMLSARPILRLALDRDERLDAALQAEQLFWNRLDACRIRLYEEALRPYVSAVRRVVGRREVTLHESHRLRVECAEAHLLPSPMKAHGLDQLVRDAREATAQIIHPALMEWLPDGRDHFIGVE